MKYKKSRTNYQYPKETGRTNYSFTKTKSYF